MPERLEFNGKPMDYMPINIGFEQAAEVFTILGKPITVVLEPGDATRYELMLVPHGKWSKLTCWSPSDFVVTVVRYVSGEAVEADTFRWSTFGYHDLTNLGRNNQWTRKFLAWWLESFREKGQQIKNGSANSALSNLAHKSDKHPTFEGGPPNE